MESFHGPALCPRRLAVRMPACSSTESFCVGCNMMRLIPFCHQSLTVKADEVRIVAVMITTFTDMAIANAASAIL